MSVYKSRNIHAGRLLISSHLARSWMWLHGVMLISIPAPSSSLWVELQGVGSSKTSEWWKMRDFLFQGAEQGKVNDACACPALVGPVPYMLPPLPVPASLSNSFKPQVISLTQIRIHLWHFIRDKMWVGQNTPYGIDGEDLINKDHPWVKINTAGVKGKMCGGSHQLISWSSAPAGLFFLFFCQYSRPTGPKVFVRRSVGVIIGPKHNGRDRKCESGELSDETFPARPSRSACVSKLKIGEELGGFPLGPGLYPTSDDFRPLNTVCHFRWLQRRGRRR